ncbi:MAG: hypothetical protein U1E14_11705 [Geminicoccaceae bacterium]
MLPADATAAIVDQVAVGPGLEAALAAALGDDLLAGTDPAEAASWRDLNGAGRDDPALPAGCTAIAEQVRAPRLLARRLAQIGVAAAAEAERLQPSLRPGQRLVSPDGGLWRWDGLVRRADTTDAAAGRLRQRQRLAELQGLLAAAGSEVAGLAGRHEALEREARARRAALEQARREEAEAARLAETTAARLAAAEAEARRLHAEAGEIERIGRSLDEAESRLAAERAALVSVGPDEVAGAAQAAAVAEQRRREAQQAVAQAREARAAAERAIVQGESGLRELRQALERARAEAQRRRETDARRRQLDAELETAGRELADAGTREAALAEAARRSRTASDAAEAALGRLRDAADAAAAALAESRELLFAARARREQLAGAIAGLAERTGQLDGTLAELDGRMVRLEAELDAAGRAVPGDDDALLALEQDAATLESRCAAAAGGRDRLDADLQALDTRLQAAEARRGQAQAAVAVAEAERGRAESALAAARATVEERLEASPEDLAAEPKVAQALATADPEGLEARVTRLRGQRERLGLVNLRAEVEHAEVTTTLETSRREAEELQAAIERLKRAIATLNREGRERLTAVFAAVDEHFRRLFVRLFGGGKAHLRLTDTEDPFAAGLELEASPPGKKLTSVHLLSGGEKTLTALALVFALFLSQPSPLCVLDEVDAPLDDANVDRFVALMKEIAAEAGTRFLVVTHHPLTMSHMDRLYGVTMIERGISRIVSVALQEAVELRATA